MIVFFDGDRTIWNPTYDYEDCYKNLKEWMYDKHMIDAPIDVIETSVRAYIKFENKRNNYHRSVFPLCVMRAFNAFYLNTYGTTPTVDELSSAFKIGDEIYDHEPKLVDDFNSTMVGIFSGITDHVRLLTSGDNIVQKAKIYNLKIGHMFEKITIVKNKSAQVYEDITAKDKKINPNNIYVMIGDSVEHDINPAIESGWYGIYIKSKKKEKAELIKSDRLYEAKDINEALDCLYDIKSKLVYDSDSKS